VIAALAKNVARLSGHVIVVNMDSRVLATYGAQTALLLKLLFVLGFGQAIFLEALTPSSCAFAGMAVMTSRTPPSVVRVVATLTSMSLL